MTEKQVDRIVQHLCEHMHVAIRLKGNSPVAPPNLRELGFDPATVRTVFLTAVHSAGISTE
jgi:hypothetical protein